MAELEQLKGKNWMAAMTLCWLFGSLVGHRFYTGKTGSAWAMFALSILGLFPITYIWSVVDGFQLAFGKYQHEDGGELYEKVVWYGYVYIASVVLTVLGVILYSTVLLAAIVSAKSGVGAGAQPVVAP